ncbi:phosphoribosyl-ATP diphosphatase [Aestuariivirga litoralis]|uniref:Phosphoribosyl-ATP pyrophosphatase n=1 Tax=Aestuariivirga litoralis TaxID=2650924 RepID=A0A2W2AQB4_9HYPH|nr:phosphoribosyl-ATP diphosphatase [Aestuariivirga litoralis]PZF77595.1 phosphoribosyl-ATP diphosphatase [Aestuariivirga litoralis]
MTDHRLDVLAALGDEVMQRRQASPETSYTAKLLSQGVEKCAKKFGEEAVELALAAVLREKAHTTSEAADVLYHLLVLLTAADVKLSDVMAELARRQGMSGLAEKASRPKD